MKSIFKEKKIYIVFIVTFLISTIFNLYAITILGEKKSQSYDKIINEAIIMKSIFKDIKFYLTAE